MPRMVSTCQGVGSTASMEPVYHTTIDSGSVHSIWGSSVLPPKPPWMELQDDVMANEVVVPMTSCRVAEFQRPTPKPPWIEIDATEDG